MAWPPVALKRVLCTRVDSQGQIQRVLTPFSARRLCPLPLYEFAISNFFSQGFRGFGVVIDRYRVCLRFLSALKLCWLAG